METLRTSTTIRKPNKLGEDPRKAKILNEESRIQKLEEVKKKITIEAKFKLNTKKTVTRSQSLYQPVEKEKGTQNKALKKK